MKETSQRLKKLFRFECNGNLNEIQYCNLFVQFNWDRLSFTTMVSNIFFHYYHYKAKWLMQITDFYLFNFSFFSFVCLVFFYSSFICTRPIASVCFCFVATNWVCVLNNVFFLLIAELWWRLFLCYNLKEKKCHSWVAWRESPENLQKSIFIFI